MTALILIDIQNDFLPAGSLPVEDGDKIIPVANRMLMLPFDRFVASQDWHPQHHKSFAREHDKKPGEIINLDGLEQILWPVHCVKDSKGAEFPESLGIGKIEQIIRKGIDEQIDSYSAFFDNGHRRDTGLNQYLLDQGIKQIWLMGLATDVCVKYSVLDALKLGFETHVIVDGCRGIDLKKGDVEAAFKEMETAGAKLTTSDHVERELET